MNYLLQLKSDSQHFRIYYFLLFLYFAINKPRFIQLSSPKYKMSLASHTTSDVKAGQISRIWPLQDLHRPLGVGVGVGGTLSAEKY